MLGLFIIALLAVACTPEISETDESIEQGEVSAALVSVQVFPESQERRVLSKEDLDLENCRGNQPLSSTIERTHTIFHVAEIGTSAEVNVSGSLGVAGVGEVEVGTAIAAHYNVSYGEEESVSRSVSVSAEKGSHVIHTVEQYEKWELGKISVFVGGEEMVQEPYSFRKGFGVEVIDIVNVGGCDPTLLVTSTDFGSEATPTNLPTYTPYPTFTSEPKETATPRAMATPIPPTATPKAADTPPGTVLGVGETWYQGGMEARVSNINFASQCYHGTVQFDISISNNSGQTLVMNVTKEDVRVFDNNNIEYYPNYCSGVHSLIYIEDYLEAGAESANNLVLSPSLKSSTTQLIFHIEEAGRIKNAKWVVDVPR
jgi:hypothetical protein